MSANPTNTWSAIVVPINSFSRIEENCCKNFTIKKCKILIIKEIAGNKKRNIFGAN